VKTYQSIIKIICAIKDNFKTVYRCCVLVDKDHSRFSQTQFSMFKISMTKKKNMFSFQKKITILMDKVDCAQHVFCCSVEIDMKNFLQDI